MSNLMNDVTKVLSREGYNYDDDAVSRILDTYERNKHAVINTLRKHPDWNEDTMSICVPATSYHRKFNCAAIHGFVEWLTSSVFDSDEFQSNLITYCAVMGYQCDLRRGLICTNKVQQSWLWRDDDVIVDADGRLMYEWVIVSLGRYNAIPMVWPKVARVLRFINSLNTTFFSPDMDDVLREINSDFPAFHLRNNMKTSKAIGKICREMGWDKFPDFNRKYAALCDEINPLTVQTPTYISVHPCDYLYMSKGNSWHSCHDIRDAEDPGCYSSGTISYMLDHYSFIVYTLPDVVTENPWNEPKLQREVFALKDGVMLQSRLYPQSCDEGAEDAYREIRNVVQKVIADCLEKPNLWQTKHSPNVEQYIIHEEYATCYPDWEGGNPGSSHCSLTFLKGIDLTDFTMEIGETPICPHCGEYHYRTESIMCDDCANTIACEDCGCEINRDDAHEIDGEYYCEDCIFWCEYHEEYEPIANGVTEIDGYGQVCDRALESGDFYCCEDCGTWKYIDEVIFTEDGYSYCSEECAINNGYRETVDGWYPESETAVCPHCGGDYLKESYHCGWCGALVEEVVS